MEKYVYYRAADVKPAVDKEQIAIPLEDKDFMIMNLIKNLTREIEAARLK